MSLTRLPPPPGEHPSDEGDAQMLRELLFTLNRQRWLVLGVTLAVLALSLLYTWRREPQYQSETTLRVTVDGAGENPLEQLSSMGGSSEGQLETEMMFLRSRQMLQSVADSLDLNVRLMSPGGRRSQVLQTLDVPANAPRGRFTLERQKNGTYAVSAEGYTGGQLPRVVEPGVPFRLGSATLALSPALVITAPSRIEFTMNSLPATAGSIRVNLNVFRPDVMARVVAVRYHSEDPELAAAVPNALAAEFVRYKSLASKSQARSTVQFLRGQVASYEAELQVAEDRVRAYREREQVVNLTDEATQQVRRLADLEASRDQLRSERESLAGLLARVSQGVDASEQVSPYRQLASFPVFLGNQAVTNILQSLTELENERTRMLVLRTTENTDIRGIDQRIRELELQLYRMAQNYLESLDSQIRSADASLQRFGRQLETIPAREVQFARLSREQELLSSLYTLLQTRLKEAEIREAVEPGQVEVIDSALVSNVPFSPKPVRNMVLGGVLGLMVGVGVALARRAMDTKVRSREDVEGVTGGAAILGMIPRIRAPSAPAAAEGANGTGAANGRGGRRIIPVSPESILVGSSLVTKLDPRSPASEAYRALRTNITFSRAEEPPQVVVVTSAMPGDGKSTSASNLAITLAQQGTNALLIDADLRRGVLHELFEMPQSPGLAHLLLSRATLNEAIRSINVSESGVSLDVMPSGVLPPNPAELLGSPTMRDLLQQLRQRYEMIVIDAAPLNLVTDAAVIGTQADCTILVVRAGITDKRALHHAARQLQHIGAPVAGIILNDIGVRGGSYQAYGGYGYGYGYGVEKSRSS